MVLRRHLLSTMTMLTLISSVMVASVTVTLAQGLTAPTVDSAAISASQTPNFVGVFGAVNQPGVYEFPGERTTIGQVIEQAGQARPDAVSIGLVRPIPVEQIALQKRHFEAEGFTEEQYRPLMRVNDNFPNQALDSLILPGDIIVVDSSLPGVSQPAEQNQAVAGNESAGFEVDLMLVNLLGRPVHLSWKANSPNDSSLKNLLENMGQDTSEQMQSSVMIIDTRSNVDPNAPAPQFSATEPLPAGTIIIFDPEKIKFDQIPQTVFNFIPQPTPFKVASNPEQETRTDVPQSDLRSAQVPVGIVPDTAVTEPVEVIPVQPEVPEPQLTEQITQPVQETESSLAVPLPELEEELLSSKMSDPPSSVQVLPPAPEMGISVDMAEEEQFALGTADIPAPQSMLPTYTESVDSELQMFDPVSRAIAQNPTAGDRWNTANLVVIGLLVLTGLTLGWTRYNNKRTSVRTKSKGSIRPQARSRQSAAQQKMDAAASTEVDPKLESYRQKIERRRKIHATSRHRDQELEVEALINDMLPVKEEEVDISRTFHLPGVGQSFRLDPASSELRGPHFRQAAQVNQQQKQTAKARVDQPVPSQEGDAPAAPQPKATGLADSNKVHHVHQGGHSPMGMRKQSAPNNQGSYQQ